jgi:hypothetical protein
MEAEVAQALRDGGDASAAMVWSHACHALDETALRVALVARDGAVAVRTARRLETAFPGVVWIPFGYSPSDDEPAFGHDDRLLGAHAWVWVTALPAALGHEERRAIELLEASGAPAHRACLLAETELIAQISDEPARELADVRARLAALLPPDFALHDDADLAGWISASTTALGELRVQRRKAVALRLLDEAITDAAAARDAERGALGGVDALLEAEDAAVARIVADGERTAAHVLGAMKRHLEAMRVDLRGFLEGLERDLPVQFTGIDDVDVLRRTVPHWLHHVIETQVSDRLASWRVAVLADLADVGVDPADAARAHLLVPSLHPPPSRADGSWTHRFGVSLAIGGGAAMLLFGLWLPGAAALTGGFLWSAFGRDARDAKNRELLLSHAQAAVRRMGDDAETLLADQLAQIQADLAQLGTVRARDQEQQRADVRARLLERRSFHRARIEAAAATHARLVERRGAVG